MRTKVLVLGCNYDQIPYLEVLSERFYVIGTDLNENAPGKEFCDSFHIVGYDQVDEVLEIVKKHHFSSSDLIFSAAAQFSHLTAAIIAEYIGIPYIKPETVKWILDKTLFYDKFKEYHLEIPETRLISSEAELVQNLKEGKIYYLKSDFSKNPNYIYKVTSENFYDLNIFWGRDRYLRSHYVLQEEFIGEHLRLNLIGDHLYIYPLNDGYAVNTNIQSLREMGLINKLQTLCKDSGLDKWVVKFDVVVSSNSYVLLDIGIDPPMRMKKSCERMGFPFYREYINLVFNEKYNVFPNEKF